MKKYLFILSFFACLSTKLSAQPERGRVDSLKIDSMKNEIPLLKDQALVDCLNEICRKYTLFQGTGGIGIVQRADSIFHFAQRAYDEATRIEYKHGIVISLLNMAKSKQYSMQKGQEVYVRPALKLAQEMKNDQLIAEAYYLLAGVENRNDNYKKAIFYFQKAGDLQKETEVTTWLCMSYCNVGNYETALPYCDKCLTLAQQNVKKDISAWGLELVQWSFLDMAEIYRAAGDYEIAMSYLFKGRYADSTHLGWENYLEISELYCRMRKFDSALLFWSQWKNGSNADGWGRKAIGNTILAQIYLGTNQTGKVIPLLRDDIVEFRKRGKEFGSGIIRPLLFTGNAYAQTKNYPVALKYAREALAYANEYNYRPFMIEIYESLSKIYHHAGNNDSAYEYLLKFTAIKDSIQNRQFLLRLNNYKRETDNTQKEARIGFLNRDNKIKQQKLKQETTFRNFIITGFIALFFAALYLFRSLTLKRKNEKLKQEQREQEWKLKELENENKHVGLQRQSAELEMQALRAQMNPHFIFNSLSSINHFILKNESKTASNYLTRFSRLIRMVLINSQKSLITLEDELQMLDLYLEMERLRFKNSFDYSIKFLNTIDSDNIFMPPLLLQPFCENAIWHGLMHKEGQGRLDIELGMENNILNCTVTDNGIGREKAEEMKSKSAEKEKSMGLRITEGRLNLLNREKGIHTYYNIEDLKDSNGNSSGTRVHLKISYQKAMEAVNT